MNNYKNLIALLREYSTRVNPGITALMLNAANALEISSQTIDNHDSKYCGERMKNQKRMRHGTWEKAPNLDVYTCSCCGRLFRDWAVYYGYCPYCGAEMSSKE